MDVDDIYDHSEGEWEDDEDFADLDDEQDIEDIDEVEANRQRLRDAAGGGADIFKRPRSKMSPGAAKLLGEANFAFAERNFDKAKMYLEEVIKECPQAPEPFHTLGLLYDELGQTEKAIKYFLIAAHLTENEVGLWKQLVTVVAQKIGDWHQAHYCYSRVCRLDKKDAESQKLRGEIAANHLGDNKLALEAYRAYYALCPDDHEAGAELARLYHVTGNTDKAKEILKQQFKSMKEEADRNVNYEPNLNLVNLISEVYMGLKKWQKAADIIAWAQHHWRSSVSLFPIQLTVNFGICQLNLGNENTASKCFSRLKGLSVADNRDLYIEISKAYMQNGYYENALQYLLDLEQVQQDSKIWFHIAQCYRFAEKHQEAITYYTKAFNECPKDASIAAPLVEQLALEGMFETALEITEKHQEAKKEANEEVDILMQVLRGLVLYNLSEYLRFLELCLPIVTDKSLRFYRSYKSKKQTVLVQDDIPVAPTRRRKASSSPPPANSPPPQAATDASEAMEIEEFDEESDDETQQQHQPRPGKLNLVELIGQDAFIQLIKYTIKALMFFGRSEEADSVASSYLRYILRERIIQLSKDELHQLRFLAAKAAMQNKNYFAANRHLRILCTYDPDNVQLWNMLYLSLQQLLNSGDYSPTIAAESRYLARLCLKYPQNVCLRIMTGHHYSLTGNYKAALVEYFAALKEYPYLPLISLSLANGYLQHSTSRKAENRHLNILQAFTFFFKYANISNWSQEATYNVARAFHQWELYQWAIPLYNKVLSQSVSGVQRDLRREAAYNLAQIYIKSGNLPLARKILRDYVTI